MTIASDWEAISTRASMRRSCIRVTIEIGTARLLRHRPEPASPMQSPSRRLGITVGFTGFAREYPVHLRSFAFIPFLICVKLLSLFKRWRLARGKNHNADGLLLIEPFRADFS
jgi:hypothetical protein